MTEADWAAVVAAWQIPSDDTVNATMSAPSVFLAAKAGLIGRAIRIKYGMQLRFTEVAANAAAVALASPSLPSTSPCTAPPSNGRKVKMSQVVDRSIDEEVGLMDEDSVKRAYARYDLCMGGIQPESVEPSIE